MLQYNQAVNSTYKTATPNIADGCDLSEWNKLSVFL